jgi:O-antigen/teichoic acid export membrane protein
MRSAVRRVSSPADPAVAAEDVQAFAREGSLTLVGVGIGATLQFALVLVVTHGLDAGEAGTFLETVSLFTILSLSALLGADAGLVRTIPRLLQAGRVDDVRLTARVALVPVAAVAAVAAVVVYVLAPDLAHVFFDSAHRAGGAAEIRRVIPLLPLSALMTVALAGTRAFGTMVPYVLVQNVALPAVRVAVVLVVVAAGLGGIAVALAWSLPLAAGGAAALLILSRLIARTPRIVSGAGVVRAVASGFWRFAAPRALAYVFEVIVLSLDVLLVGAIASTREAAIYAAATRLASVGTFLLQAISRPLAPQFSALLARGERDRTGALYQLATWWVMALSWPAYLLFAVYARLILRIFGHEYHAGATALLILSVGYLFVLGSGNVTPLLLMAGKSSWNLLNSACGLALNVALNLALIPRIGIAGAAVAAAVTMTAMNLAAIVELRFLVGLRPFGRGYPVVALAALGCYGGLGIVLRFGLGATPAALAAAAFGGTLAYAVVLRRFRETLHLRELGEVVTAALGPARKLRGRKRLA